MLRTRTSPRKSACTEVPTAPAPVLSARGPRKRGSRRARRGGDPVRATPAPFVVAGHLGITAADPVLETVFTVEHPHRVVLEWVRIHVHPDHATPQEFLDLRAGTWSASERL
jgi:hypothetical protein